MGKFTIHWEGKSSVPPSAARAWFFDLREDDHAGPEHAKLFKGRAPTRKVLSRGKDEVVIEDDFGRGPLRNTVRLVGPDTIGTKAVGKGLSTEGSLKFLPDGKGTRIVTDITFKVGGFAALFTPLIRKQVKDVVPKDMDLHAREMEKEWKSRPW